MHIHGIMPLTDDPPEFLGLRLGTEFAQCKLCSTSSKFGVCLFYLLKTIDKQTLQIFGTMVAKCPLWWMISLANFAR